MRPSLYMKFCEGAGLVKRVHTLLGGEHRLATALKEVEEVRQQVREVNDEKVERSMSRENSTHHERMWMTLK